MPPNRARRSRRNCDLCIAQGKPSSAVHAYLQALGLEPSRNSECAYPSHRRKVGCFEPRTGNLQAYQKLLQAFPDY